MILWWTGKQNKRTKTIKINYNYSIIIEKKIQEKVEIILTHLNDGYTKHK